MKNLLVGAAAIMVAMSATPSHAQTVDKAQMSNLYTVQNKVNSEIQFTPEKDGKDVWQIPTIKGDCEDFALLKRKLLVEKYGWPIEDLKILLLFKPTDKPRVYEGHTVLYVKSADVVLDNSSSTDQRYKPGVEDYSLFLERKNFKFRCVLADDYLGQTKGAVTSRCGPNTL